MARISDSNCSGVTPVHGADTRDGHSRLGVGLERHYKPVVQNEDLRGQTKETESSSKRKAAQACVTPFAWFAKPIPLSSVRGMPYWVELLGVLPDGPVAAHGVRGHEDDLQQRGPHGAALSTGVEPRDTTTAVL
jgi:hypothetical protein